MRAGCRRLAVALMMLALVFTVSTGLNVKPAKAADLDDVVFLNTNDSQSVGYLAYCGRFWPKINTFDTANSDGFYLSTWWFNLSESELNALKCMNRYFGVQFVELDFRLFGFALPAQWENYAVLGTNIPGAHHDVAFQDSSASPTPGVTNIHIGSLRKDTWYHATLGWSASLGSGGPPRVSFEWVPSHWANLLNPSESPCWGPYIASGLNPAWCIFGTTRAYVSQGYYGGSTPFNGGANRRSFPSSTGVVPASGPVTSVSGSGGTAGGGVASYDGTIRINGTNGQGVKLRSQPNTTSAQVGGIPEGTVVHPACYARGENVGGTNLWWKVAGGYYSSFYDSVPLEWQNAIEHHYGIQSCDAVADDDADGVRNIDDACRNQPGPAQLRGCPPSRTQRDLVWYDGSTLWGLKGPGAGTVAGVGGFGRPDWAGVGDYDHDGREDLFWYHESSTTIYVILGGDFSRVVAARGPGIGRPVWASTGDFDGNGFRDDIAWYDGSMLFLFKGAGLPTVFQTAGYSPPDWAGVGDINQDGKDDLFWYHGGGNGTIYGLHSTGSGFGGAYAIRGPGIGAPQWAGVGDFDGNGKRNDLAWYSGGVLFTFTGPGLPTTGVRHGYAVPDWAGVGQCDASGRDSLYWYHGQGNGTIYCIHNNGREFTDASAVRGPGVGQPVWAGTGDMYP